MRLRQESGSFLAQSCVFYEIAPELMRFLAQSCIFCEIAPEFTIHLAVEMGNRTHNQRGMSRQPATSSR